MKAINLTPEFENISRRVIWFENPEQAVSDPVRFITYAMTYGTHQDMKAIRNLFSDEELVEVLNQAPPGIFDGRSWVYWNLKLGQYPAPAMPKRRFE
jgi:hypothetical protein